MVVAFGFVWVEILVRRRRPCPSKMKTMHRPPAPAMVYLVVVAVVVVVVVDLSSPFGFVVGRYCCHSRQYHRSSSCLLSVLSARGAASCRPLADAVVRKEERLRPSRRWSRLQCLGARRRTWCSCWWAFFVIQHGPISFCVMMMLV